MKRERKVKVLETNIINVCGNKVTQVKQDIYERPFIIDYFPAPLHNLDNCPSCKATHKEIFTRAVVHFINFPNCCKHHSILKNHEFYVASDFKNLSKLIADKVLFTHHHITNHLYRENWYEEITNYIDYAYKSFGEVPLGCGESPGLSWFIDYLLEIHLKHTLESLNVGLESRHEKIIEYIKNLKEGKKINSDKDFGLLLTTYNNWYKFFPFELPIFSGLEKHFSSKMPVFTSKPIKNPYLGISKVKLISQEDLLNYLFSITTKILSEIDTTALLNYEYITNKTKYEFDLQKKSHKIKQETLLKQFSKGEKAYLKTIKKWLENEKLFLKEIRPTINALPIVKKDNKENKKYQSFTYKNLKLGSSNLNDLRDALKRRKLIAQETTLVDFKKVFSGVEINKPIVWKGKINQLFYFISQLHNKLELVENLKQEQWEVAIQCFVNENGLRYDRQRLRGQKPPANTEVIDKALKTLSSLE